MKDALLPLTTPTALSPDTKQVCIDLANELHAPEVEGQLPAPAAATSGAQKLAEHKTMADRVFNFRNKSPELLITGEGFEGGVGQAEGHGPVGQHDCGDGHHPLV